MVVGVVSVSSIKVRVSAREAKCIYRRRGVHMIWVRVTARVRITGKTIAAPQWLLKAHKCCVHAESV